MTKSDIAALIPHGDAMCVVDRVLNWDDKTLVAETEAHLQPEHPLYETHGSSVLLVEYAAQAAAVHAALNHAGLGAQRPAYLGAMKNIKMHVPKLSEDLGVLTMNVTCVLSDNNGAIYELNVVAGQHHVIEGRLVLVQP